MGMKIGQVALRFGCNDFGSLMLEENVVSAANTTYRTSIAEMERLIRDAGFTPARRKQDYSLLEPASVAVPSGLTSSTPVAAAAVQADAA
jgi:cyclic dehypoxanthinyl futalosine synthase